MLVTTDDIIAAWLSPSRQLSIRVKVDDATYGSEDVTSLSFDSGSISGETYQIGSTYMNSIQLIFPSLIETVKEDMEVVPELGVLVNGTYEYTKLGHFFIDEFERNRNSNTTTIKATDKMRFMEGPYESKLSYPRAYRDVALEIANLSGVEVNQHSFASLGIGAINKPVDYTFRQAIGLIAQFEGGFASFNRNGELEIRRLAPTTFEINPESYMLKGFTKNEVSYRIGGISVKTGEEETDVIRVGSTNGSQVQLENKVMTQQLLNQTWELVKDLNYFPYELKWRGCPPLEAGDWIYITANDGTKYSVPNLSYSITFNGGMSAESKATTSSSSQATYKYRGPLSQRIDYLDTILSSNNWNSNYYDTTEPPNPKEGDVWFKPNGQDTEIWIYRNVDGVLKWVMEITSAGDPELLAAIEDAKQAGQDAEAAAKEAKEEAESAKQAGENAANLATQAGLDAQAAKDKADAIKIDVNGLVSDVATINGTVSSISSKANQAYDKANAVEGRTATLETSVTGLTGRITDVESNATSTIKKLNELVVTVDGQKQTIATVTNTANSALSKANVLETTVDGVKQTLTSVEKWQNDFNIDTRNWLSGTAQAATLTGNGTLNQTVYPYRFTFEVLREIPANVGDSVVIAYDWEVLGENISGRFFPQFSNVPYSIAGRPNITVSDENRSGSASFVTPVLADWLSSAAASIGFRADELQGTLRITHVRFLIANNDSGWSPAPEDMATVTKVNQIESTVNGTIQTVSQVKETADSALAKATQVETTVEGVKTTVSNVETTANSALTKATQVEQTAEGIRQTVTEVQGEIADLANRFTDYNFKKQTPKPIMQDSNITAVYDDNGIVFTNNGTEIRRAYWSLAGMAIGKSYNIKMYANVGTSSVNKEIEVGFSGGENFKFSIPAANTPTWISGTARASGNGTAVSFWIPAGGAIRLRELYVYEANTNITSSQITQLSDTINLKVEKNDVINQINISTEGILIAGNKIRITGTTTIDNAVIKTAHIADLAVSNGKIANLSVTEGKIGDAAITNAKIGNLAVSTAKIADGAIVNAKIGDAAITNAKIQDASISSAKIISLDVSKLSAGTLDTSKITIYGGSSTNYIQITTNQVEQRGLFTRTWQGNTTQHNTSMFMQNGYFRARNNTLDRSLYFSDFGISTFADGDGGGVSSGTINFFDQRYGTSNGITINSKLGVVGLEAEGNRIMLDAKDSVNLNSKTSLIVIRPYIDARPGSNVFVFGVQGDSSTSASETHGFLRYGSEGNGYAAGFRFFKTNENPRIQVVDYNYSTGGNTVIESGVGQFNSVDARDGNQYIQMNGARSSMMNFFCGRTADGTRRMGSDYLYASSGSGKALHITSGGTIVAYSSSERFKEQIQAAGDVTPKALLDLDLKSWIYKSSYSLLSVGEPVRRIYGLIAEDVEKAGLKQYVEYDKTGRVEGYKPELWTVTIPILKEHEESIESLKQKVEKLEEEVKALRVA